MSEKAAESAERDDGGPAYPQHDLSSYGMGPSMRGQVPGDEYSGRYTVEGMSLRDWFAGQALAGMLASGWCNSEPDVDVDAFASDAYRAADVMLSERRK